MNVIAIENVIAIIFALTLQTTMSTRITASERANEFDELHNKQYDVIDNNIADCFKFEAWNYVKEYLVSDEELNTFIISVNKTGRPSINYKNRKLLNYVDFLILRFFTYLESTTFHLQTAMQHVERLKSLIFNDFFSFQSEKLFKTYMEKKLKEIISFENYYALLVFLENTKIQTDTPADWRMKRAIYSLLLRQYNPKFDSHSSNNPERHCYFASIRKNVMIAKIKNGMKYTNVQARLCYSKLEDVITPETKIDNLSTLVYTKVTFSKHYQILNIKEITDDNHDLYVILPETKYEFSDPYSIVHNEMSVQILPMKLIEITDILGALVRMANAIENLKTAEENYLKNLK